MNWTLTRWVWQLEAPLHVGMPPSGSLNRCRTYVPARALWGALTAEVARHQGAGFPSYRKTGEAIRQGVRLTYLYPAEQTGRGWHAWLPRYERGQGLLWQREDDRDGDEVLPDRDLRSRLLVARAGTAIDPLSDAAAEGSLRETKCIGQYWRTATGDVKPVGLVGYLFALEGFETEQALKEVQGLFIGGDSRYGLGRVRRVTWEPASRVFEIPVALEDGDPSLTTDRVLAHAVVADGRVKMCGDLEALAGWDRGAAGALSMGTAYWRPGSVAEQHEVWSLRDSGFWVAVHATERHGQS